MRANLRFVAVTLCVFLAAMAAVAAKAADSASPRLTAPVLNHKLGFVDRGRTVEQRFVLRNEGQAPLEITAVSTSCACAKARFDARIAPAGEGAVTVTVETPDLLGPVTVAVVVESNDTGLPKLQLGLEMEVRPRVMAKPGYARFQYVLGEPVGSVRQTLWSDDFDDLEIVRVESPYPFVKATANEIKPEAGKPAGKGRQWTVDVAIEPGAVVGPLTGFVRVWTNHPVDRIALLPVSGFVRPTLALTPPVAELKEFSRAAPNTFSVDVRNFATEAIEVGAMIRASWPDVKVAVTPVAAGRRFRVDITLPKGLPLGALEGSVVLATSSAKVPEIVVPIRSTVTE